MRGVVLVFDVQGIWVASAMTFPITRLFFLALLLFQKASSETTPPPNVIGYAVKEGHPITTVGCGEGRGTVTTYTSYLRGTKWMEFLSCHNGEPECQTDREVVISTLYTEPYATVAYTVTQTQCDKPDDRAPCGNIVVLETWPSGGTGMGVIDCMPRNVAASVKMLYRTEPKNLPKGFTEPTTSPIPTSKTIDDKKGDNVGLIVGAVVGSVAGCGLIAAALFLGLRIGRKRSTDQPETRPSGGIRERLQSLPRPVLSLAWGRPPKTEIGENATTIQPMAVNRDPAELDAGFNQLPAERVFVSGAEGKPPTQTWG